MFKRLCLSSAVFRVLFVMQNIVYLGRASSSRISNGWSSRLRQKHHLAFLGPCSNNVQQIPSRLANASVARHHIKDRRHHIVKPSSGPFLKAPGSNQRRSLASSSLSSSVSDADGNDDAFFASEASFEDIGIQSQILLDRLQAQNLIRPTKVQASSYQSIREGAGDVTIGAETGSGKTLAYLLPIIDDILQSKEQRQRQSQTTMDDMAEDKTYDFARAVILVPNKELVQQVLRMALPLCGGAKHALVWGGSGLPDSMTEHDNDSSTNDRVDPATIVRLAVMPGGLKEPIDFKPFRDSIGLGGNDPPVDIVLSTPAAMGPLGLKPKDINLFADIQTLVIDEADMLLDGGYIRALENVLMGFRRADRIDSSLGVKRTQHVFCAATLPDMGLRSVDAYLQRKFPRSERITLDGMHNARHYGLKEPTLWIEEEFKRDRMEKLVELLQTPSGEDGGLMNEKVMVFLNSVDDVNGATGALERAGLQAVPYHAKLSLSERSANLDRFRKYSKDGESAGTDAVPVLVCTDLASRGLDVPGVDAVVQLQFAGNVVAHLHRMGRCGRAGQRTGRGIVFYNEQERELVEVVQEAETQQERMVLEQDVDEIEEDGGEGQRKQQGTVQNAFSRKRGFTKKRKKIRRETNSSPPPS